MADPEKIARVPGKPPEARLTQLRQQAQSQGKMAVMGIRPAGAPFPRATPEAGYYGIPLLKEPQWNWAIPLYFFVGGAAGAAAVVGTAADWIGDEYRLARHARYVALGGAALSTALLVYDLGKPSRFLNMLRVFKVQSPMSMGAWTLAAFANATAAATFADLVTERYGSHLPVRLIGNAGRIFSALFGLPFSNYTGVLIGATAIPVWNKNVRTLPLHFGASGLQSAVSLLELWGHEDNRALNILGTLAALAETVEGLLVETEPGRVAEPLKHGGSGWLTRTGGVLSGPIPLLLRLVGARSPSVRRWAARCGIAGSLLTRYAWMRAGRVSARDWRIPLEIPSEIARKPEEMPAAMEEEQKLPAA